MNQIRFSHKYPKLWNQKRATLLNVRIESFFNLHSDLIVYDTKTETGEFYPLPHTDLIHLTFIGDKLIPFCTIRRLTDKKFRYYKDMIRKEFEVVI